MDIALQSIYKTFIIAHAKHYKNWLKEQLQKKPEIKELIRKDNYRDGTNIPRYDWWCPNCNLEHMSGNNLKYCPSCGQALDWSEDE